MTQKIISSIRAFEKLLHADIGFKDYLLQSNLTIEHCEHSGTKCLNVKKKHKQACVQFCGAGGRVDIELTNRGVAWNHHCPFKLAQVAVPVFKKGNLVAVLFAVAKNQPENIESWFKLCQEALIVFKSYLLKEIETNGDLNMLTSIRSKKIVDFIESRLEVDFCLTDLAKTLKLSMAHTSRWIKSHFKMTFQQLVLEIRLERAATLISQTELNMTQISHQLRFCDQAHFSKMFKRQYKISPLTHRKRQKESN